MWWWVVVCGQTPIRSNVVLLLPHLRYQAIMFPLRPHITKSRAKVTILIIWVLSTVLAVPMGLAYKIRVVSSQSPHICVQ